MEETGKINNQAWAIITWTFILSIGYAIVRYHVLGEVAWKDLPFFILNKVISMSALILLAFNFTFGPLKNLGAPIPNSWLRSRRIIGIVGFIQVFVHVIMGITFQFHEERFFELESCFQAGIGGLPPVEDGSACPADLFIGMNIVHDRIQIFDFHIQLLGP